MRRWVLLATAILAAGCASWQQPGPTLNWPVPGGRFSSPYGRRGWFGHHDGIDIAAPTGTPIRAAAEGVVIFSGRRRGYGNVVVIRHRPGWWTLYGHNNANLVVRGQAVERGQVIATVGATGHARGSNLHFEVRRDQEPVNPRPYLISSTR